MRQKLGNSKMATSAFADKGPFYDEYVRIRDEGKLLELREICQSRHTAVISAPSTTPLSLFFALKDLCDANYDCGDFAVAARYLAEAIRLDKSLCGRLIEDHAYPLVRLAYFYIRAHRIVEAELAYASAMSISTGARQPKNLLQSTQLHCLSQIQAEKHDFAEAMKTLMDSIRIRQEEFAEEETRVIVPYFDLARLLWRMGKSTSALKCAEKAYWRYELRSKGDSVVFAEFLGFFAMLKAKHGRMEDAEQLFARSLSKIRKFRPDTHPNRVEIESWANDLHATMA
jgi:tetratricopeptide (TPR) repeat protein